MDIMEERGRDEDVKRGTTYLYSVGALNEQGQREPFGEVEVKVPKQKDEGPAFGLMLTVLALMLVSILVHVTRQD